MKFIINFLKKYFNMSGQNTLITCANDIEVKRPSGTLISRQLYRDKSPQGSGVYKAMDENGNIEIIGGPGAGNPPQDISVRVFASNGQSIPNGADTAVEFSTVVYDTNVMYDALQPTKLTAKTSGKYIIQGQVQFAADPTGRRNLAIYKNGVLLSIPIARSMTNAIATGTTFMQISSVIELSVNDFVELTAEQTSGAPLTLSSSSQSTWFAMTRQPG